MMHFDKLSSYSLMQIIRIYSLSFLDLAELGNLHFLSAKS